MRRRPIAGRPATGFSGGKVWIGLGSMRASPGGITARVVKQNTSAPLAIDRARAPLNPLTGQTSAQSSTVVRTPKRGQFVTAFRGTRTLPRKGVGTPSAAWLDIQLDPVSRLPAPSSEAFPRPSYLIPRESADWSAGCVSRTRQSPAAPSPRRCREPARVSAENLQ